MANKENLPPRNATPPISRLSPSQKPTLHRQRDHSACRAVDSPLKVKKTRENLKQASAYAEVPPPCSHASFSTEDSDSHINLSAEWPTTDKTYLDRTQPASEDLASSTGLPHANQQQAHSLLPTQSRVQRQKSVSRRMLSKVKQGITSKSKSSQSIRPTGSDTSLARRLSGRRKRSGDGDARSQSFELSRYSIDSAGEEVSGVSAETPAQRSFTDSTISTSEIIDDLAALRVPSFRTHHTRTASGPALPTITWSPPSQLSSPSPEPTPRPQKAAAPATDTAVAVPCVELSVDTDTASVDVRTKRDVWVAIDATIRLKSTRLAVQDSRTNSTIAVPHDATETNPEHTDILCPRNEFPAYGCGTITNLRLCYKPAEGCRIRNIIGQKSYRDVVVGQRCTLFIKLGIPKMQKPDGNLATDQNSLFSELESMLGTLETDILHVEARYRHSMLPSDNVVALKHTCKVLRPNADSRWSIIGYYEKGGLPPDVHARLAGYLADHYPATEALELLHRYFDFDARSKPGLAEVCSMLQDKIMLQQSGLDEQQLEVVITDIDLPAPDGTDQDRERFATAPSTPLEVGSPLPGPPPADSPHLVRSSSLAPPRAVTSRTTGTFTAALHPSSPAGAESHESHDSAHQLWRHIRRSSHQLEEMTPERISSLEAGDDSLRELRRRAIANKRSIGAETLRVWKWEGDTQAKRSTAEAPWM